MSAAASAMPVPARPQSRAQSPWLRAARRFVDHRGAVAALLLLIVIALFCYCTLPWSLKHYNSQHLNHALAAPSWRHWFGTDRLGRDLVARFAFGGAISLTLGFSAALISVVIGVSVGLLAGYAGGRTDALLMRAVDVLYGLPYILVVILLRVAVVGRLTNWLATIRCPDSSGVASVLVLLAGIGGVSWLTMARVIRAQVMSLRDQPFVEAARAAGLAPARIMIRHLFPNLVGVVVVYATLIVPGAILAESALSFLGLGVQPPVPTWGSLASAGEHAINPIHIRWWLIVWPCAGLSVALLCLYVVGDAVRDALDPRGR